MERHKRETLADVSALLKGVQSDIDTLNAQRLISRAYVPQLVAANMSLAVLDSDDPSPCWNVAVGLNELGQLAEAIPWYLDAARRFRQAHESGSALTDDEDEWADSALAHAVTLLIELKRFTVGWAVTHKIQDEGQRVECQQALIHASDVGERDQRPDGV